MLYLAGCLLIVLLVMGFAIYNGIGPVPTSRKVREELLRHLGHEPKGSVAELGAGWGGLTCALAKKFPESTIIAYENSWIPYLVLKWRAIRYKNVIVSHQNFWTIDLKEHGLLVCYLYPKAMERLPLDVPLVTHTFALPGKEPSAIHRAGDLYRTPIYYYL